MPLLNLQDYTGPQLAFYATGAYLWVVAYLIYIRNGFKYRVVEMPAFAACSNIGWEVNWALLFTSDLGTLSVWAHKAGGSKLLSSIAEPDPDPYAEVDVGARIAAIVVRLVWPEIEGLGLDYREGVRALPHRALHGFFEAAVDRDVPAGAIDRGVEEALDADHEPSQDVVGSDRLAIAPQRLAKDLDQGVLLAVLDGHDGPAPAHGHPFERTHLFTSLAKGRAARGGFADLYGHGALASTERQQQGQPQSVS